MPRHHGSRNALTVVLAILITLAGVVSPLGMPLRTSAQTTSPPPARSLRLPAWAFPAGVVLRAARASNGAADAASKLHTASFAQLGRVDGYLETAWWTPPSGRRGLQLTFQYNASLFSSAGAAAAACADARASLWESGRPLQLNGIEPPAFALTERDGHQDVSVLLSSGIIESEVRLRYPPGTDSHSVATALWYLGRIAGAASHLALTLSPPGAPATAGSPAVDTSAELYVAPWGTGPIVKSPSLMTVDAAMVPADTQLDPGDYRPAAGPAIGARTVQHPALVSTGSLARYVRTGSTGAGGAWYDATGLYGTLSLAGQSFDAIVKANHASRGLQPYTLDPAIWNVTPLTSVDTIRAWRAPGELVVAVLVQNVVMVVASTGQLPSSVAALLTRVALTVPSWLRAQGIQVVDGSGQPVHLSCLNWYGAEQEDFVVGGLDYKPYQQILEQIASLGYNCVRLPFSNQLVEQNPPVSEHIGANPELAGLHALDVLDRIVGYAGALGLSVMLDDHRSEAGWSSEENGLWYTTAYPDAAFVSDWGALARRYSVNDVVVGADLRNEPHGSATWGDGNPATDWRAAAQRAGDAVLAANPHLLVIVEGIQLYGSSQSYWWGGSLIGVATAPVVLQFADGTSARTQLVYSAHDYGPDNCSTGCPWFNSSTTYDLLSQVWEEYWGYIMDDPTKPYAAPVWLGEFGTCNYSATCVSSTTPGSQGQWFSSLVRYIAAKHLSWAYWAANGTESTSTAASRIYGNLDWYGLFTRDWTAPIPWIIDSLRPIQSDDDMSGEPPSFPAAP